MPGVAPVDDCWQRSVIAAEVTDEYTVLASATIKVGHRATLRPEGEELATTVRSVTLRFRSAPVNVRRHVTALDVVRVRKEDVEASVAVQVSNIDRLRSEGRQIGPVLGAVAFRGCPKNRRRRRLLTILAVIPDD